MVEKFWPVIRHIVIVLLTLPIVTGLAAIFPWLALASIYTILGGKNKNYIAYLYIISYIFVVIGFIYSGIIDRFRHKAEQRRLSVERDEELRQLNAAREKTPSKTRAVIVVKGVEEYLKGFSKPYSAAEHIYETRDTSGIRKTIREALCSHLPNADSNVISKLLEELLAEKKNSLDVLSAITIHNHTVE